MNTPLPEQGRPDTAGFSVPDERHDPLDALPDLVPLIDAMRDDVRRSEEALAKSGHTVCGACVELGLLIAQRAIVRSVAAAAEPEDRPVLLGESQRLENELRTNWRREVVKA